MDENEQRLDALLQSNRVRLEAEEYTRSNVDYLKDILKDMSKAEQWKGYKELSGCFVNELVLQQEMNYCEPLSSLQQKERDLLQREVSRVIQKTPQSQQLDVQINRMVNWRLQEIRRNTKQDNIDTCYQLLQQLIRLNPINIDTLETLKGTVFSVQTREFIWKNMLEEKGISEEYEEKVKNNRLMTVSRYDVQIQQDIYTFSIRQPEVDGKQLQLMKRLLSYYERHTNTILSDYLYLLSLLLVQVVNPIYVGQGIGQFFQLVSIIKEIDPFLDLLLKQDDEYENGMMTKFFQALATLDNTLPPLFQQFDLQLLLIFIQNFIYSFGYHYLTQPIALFIADQIIMKVTRDPIEVFLHLAITIFILKQHFLTQNNNLNFQSFLNLYQTNCQSIQLQLYVELYNQVFKDLPFYQRQLESDKNQEQALSNQPEDQDKMQLVVQQNIVKTEQEQEQQPFDIMNLI